MVEHFIGNEEVEGSIPFGGTISRYNRFYWGYLGDTLTTTLIFNILLLAAKTIIHNTIFICRIFLSCHPQDKKYNTLSSHFSTLLLFIPSAYGSRGYGFRSFHVRQCLQCLNYYLVRYKIFVLLWYYFIHSI